jgi:hypothetical protein
VENAISVAVGAANCLQKQTMKASVFAYGEMVDVNWVLLENPETFGPGE